MATLEDAYKEYELDKFFKFNNNTNEFSQQFGQITNLPPIEKSFVYKQPLMKKYGLKRENIIPLGKTKDLYCLQDTSTKIYYTVNPYKADPLTDWYVCDYLFLNEDSSVGDTNVYKSAVSTTYNINYEKLDLLGLTYNKLYCFLDTSTKTYYTVNPEKASITEDYKCDYLFKNQDPNNDKKNIMYGLDKDPVTKLFCQ
jgi:hypothetical protein